MRNIMSNVCCKEFKGWVKSFTKIERVLAVLEAVLLVSFIILVILLIVHLLACSRAEIESPHVMTSTAPRPIDHHTDDVSSATSGHAKTTDAGMPLKTTKERITWDSNFGNTSEATSKVCSWTPSAKTAAVTHYYEDGYTHHPPVPQTSAKVANEIRKNNYTLFRGSTSGAEDAPDPGYLQEPEFSDPSESVDADDEYKSYVMALVKVKPPNDVTFGCILTAVSERWALTAASCIEAIEEMDSLDSFVIVRRYGAAEHAPPRAVRDVRVHPLYEGGNRSYDLAAVRGAAGRGAAPRLASMLDYALSAVGESFTVLGYGPFRSAFRSGRRGAAARGLQVARVRRLPARACGAEGAGAGAGWALRHLLPGRAGGAARCARAALCAGAAEAADAAGAACQYCAGTPLLRRRTLFGLMADNPRCGLSCEPTLYVNIADLADWIRSVVRHE